MCQIKLPVSSAIHPLGLYLIVSLSYQSLLLVI